MPNRKQPEYSQDELVLNLASQLYSGAIDPGTFKCAYQSIFPGDHQEELLRRLVELLGAQRLSSDLFRAAYEVVNATEPPAKTFREDFSSAVPACIADGGSETSSTACSYGPGVRSQVFEVIVHQAMAGAPWEEICAGPMQVNRITPEEVMEEVRRRLGGDQPPTAPVPRQPLPSEGSGSIALLLPSAADNETE